MKKVLFILFFGGFTTFLAAQSVESQIIAVGAALAKEGFEISHELKFENLNQGDTDSYTFELQKGLTYTLVAVCDGDCSDIDATIYDENNHKIDEDKEEDDVATVAVTPEWTGQFSVKVHMFDCTANPCRFGFAIFVSQ
jgi:hypothetical protein